VAKYQIPVIRKVMDVYEVEASSDRDAAVQLGVLIATNAEPFRTVQQSMTTLKPVKDPDKFVKDTDDDTNTEAPAAPPTDDDAPDPGARRR